MATLHVPTPPLTNEDYRAMPENGPRYQLIEGDLYMAPAPNRFHQDISRNLMLAMGWFLQNNPLGVIYDAPFDVDLDAFNTFQPDISFFANDNLSVLTEQGASGAPDLVVEILSVRTASIDLKQKRRIYEKYRVKELWFIDPWEQTVEVQRLGAKKYEKLRLTRHEEKLSTPLLPGFEIMLSQVFAQPGGSKD